MPVKNNKPSDYLGNLLRVTQLVVVLVGICVSVIFFFADLKNGIQDNKDHIKIINDKVKFIETKLRARMPT